MTIIPSILNLLRNYFKPLTIFSFLLINIYFSNGQAATGGYSSSYLFRDIGARPIALAGAYTALVNEPSGIFYNPAGLGFFSEEPIITTMYSFLDFGRNHSALAFAKSLEDNIGIGFGINLFNSGTFLGRNVKGNPTNRMYNLSYSLTGSAAYRIEFASLGVSFKYLSDRLYGSNIKGDGFSFDLGMKFDVAGLFSYGIVMQDLSAFMHWNSSNTELIPYTIKTGVAMEYPFNEKTYTTRNSITGEIETFQIPATQYAILTFDIYMRQYERSPKYIIGAEVSMHEIFAIRGGICIYGEKIGEPMFFPMNLWGAGFALRPRFDDLPFNVNIEYAISTDRIANTNVAHHLSLVFEL